MLLKRELGKTGIHPTVLGFGAMELRHMEETPSLRLLNAVLDMGIGFIDTSPCYGRSEEFIGKAVSHRRDEFILATKCACNMDSGKVSHIFTREQFERNLDSSLKLLKTDYIDIWQIHAAMPHDLTGEAGDEAVDFLRDLKKKGKIGAVSISFKNASAPDPLYPAGYSLECFEGFIDRNCFDSMQTVYGALTRDCENYITRAHSMGTGIIARGLLNRYTPAHADYPERAGLYELLESGESINDFLIRFAITHPGVSAAIVGSSNIEHMKANIAAAEKGVLPDDVYALAKKKLDAIGVTPA